MHQPYISPETEVANASSPQQTDKLDKAAIWAGYGLLASGVLGLIAILKDQSMSSSGPPIDFSLGLGILVIQRTSLVRLARIRVLVGLLISLPLTWLNGGWAMPWDALLFIGLGILLSIKGLPYLRWSAMVLVIVALLVESA